MADMAEVTTQIWARGQADSSAPLIVALHGYGSHEGDLAGLAPMLPQTFDVVSLRAPLQLETGMGFMWFPLMAQAPGGLGYAPLDPAERYRNIHLGAEAVERWLEREIATPRAVIPLGFSQGGALAIELLRRNPTRYPAAVALSALISPNTVAGDEQLARDPVPVFWGRADVDSVISSLSPELTPPWLHDHTVLTEKIYPGIDHSVSLDEIADLSDWLTGLRLV